MGKGPYFGLGCSEAIVAKLIGATEVGQASLGEFVIESYGINDNGATGYFYAAPSNVTKMMPKIVCSELDRWSSSYS